MTNKTKKTTEITFTNNEVSKVTEKGIYQFLSEKGLTEELEFAKKRFYNVREMARKIPSKTFTCELLSYTDYKSVVKAIRKEMDTVYYLKEAIEMVEDDSTTITIPELLGWLETKLTPLAKKLELKKAIALAKQELENFDDADIDID